MVKYILILIPIILVAIFLYFHLQNNSTSPAPATQDKESTNSPIEAPSDFTAEFSITTNGTVRTFANPMYHNLSEDVYIENSNPNTVNVKRSGVSWNDFFNTLPFSLSKDCLTTGTGQTFCTNENGTLRFFINGVEDSNALDKEIQPNDNLEVIY